MKAVVIGAGVSGLAFANRLQELARAANNPLDITVLEASPASGGVVSTVSREGFLLENGPDAFLTEDSRILDFCRKLGLEGELQATERSHRGTYVVRRGKLELLPKGFFLVVPRNIPAFLSSPIFSPLGKLRMLAEPFIPRSKKEDESVASFIRRRFGREALERAGQPMIAGVHCGDPEELSIRHVMKRLGKAEERSGSVLRGLEVPKSARGPRYALFWTFKNGMQTLTDMLEKKVQVQRGFSVSSVSRLGLSWVVTSKEGATVQADILCIATSARRAGEWLKPESPKLAAPLSEIRYQSVATLNLAFDRTDIEHPMLGFGFVSPRTEKKTVMACTFAHRKFAGRAPKGKALLRVFVGGAFGADILKKSDKDIEQAVRSDLESLMGIRKKPLFTVLTRHQDSLPQYCVGHTPLLERIDAEEAALPGLFLTGSSYRGTGIPDCVANAEDAAERAWKQRR